MLAPVDRQVAVLEGGLPAWTSAGLPTETGGSAAGVGEEEEEPWVLKQEGAQWSIEEVHDNIISEDAQLVDARPAGRFWGTTPEPRAGRALLNHYARTGLSTASL